MSAVKGKGIAVGDRPYTAKPHIPREFVARYKVLTAPGRTFRATKFLHDGVLEDLGLCFTPSRVSF